MSDRELLELMKVTLKEVLRAELTHRDGGRLDFLKSSPPSSELVAARAYGYARAAQLRLQEQPVHDRNSPTIQPPPAEKCWKPLCSRAPIPDSDFCEEHQG